MTDHLVGLLKIQDEQNQTIGRLVVIKEVLQWALEWQPTISPAAMNSLATTLERLRHAPPS